jgi:hypothetical protein
MFLERESSTFSLLLTTQLKVFAALERELMLLLTNGAFQPEDDFLGSLGLLLEDGFGLATETLLFAIVTTFSEDKEGGFSGFVLGDLLGGVFIAFLAIGVASFGNVHLKGERD